VLIGRLAHRWGYNIKMNLNEIGWGGVDWMDLAYNVVGSCEHGNEYLDFNKSGEFCA